MLHKKEISYLSNKNYPYPGKEYARMALQKLKENIELYENYYMGKEYDIVFSDGSDLKFEIQDKFVAHMVGLDSSRIREIELAGTNNSTYQIIKNIIENPEDAMHEDELKNNDIFNYYRIKVRSDIFKKFSNFYDMNFGCIKYDRTANQTNSKMQMKSDLFLFLESDELVAQYYMMGIAKSGDQNYIETLFPDTFPEAMFTNQTVVIPTHMTVSNDKAYYRDITSSDKTKLELLKKYREQLKQYNVQFDVFQDYQKTLSRNVEEHTRRQIL